MFVKCQKETHKSKETTTYRWDHASNESGKLPNGECQVNDKLKHNTTKARARYRVNVPQTLTKTVSDPPVEHARQSNT